MNVSSSLINEFKIKTKKMASLHSNMRFLPENTGDSNIRYRESRFGEMSPILAPQTEQPQPPDSSANYES